MFRYFVRPYNDEVLYSQLARLYLYTMQSSTSKFMFDLFGKRNAKAIIDLPNNLSALHKRYFYFIDPSIDKLIENHTLYPYYENFLFESRQFQVKNLMKDGSARSIQLISGINGSSLSPSKFPRYCSICYKESIEKNNEPYWTRVHQIDSVIVCPIHNIYLQKYIPNTNELNKGLYINANSMMQADLKVIENKNVLMHTLSKVHADLLLNQIDLKQRSTEYVDRLRNSCFQFGSKLSLQSLMTEIKKFYGEEVLNSYLGYNKRNNLDWIKYFIANPNAYFDPAKHILLDYFLNNYDFKKLLFKMSEWDGPWKCKNIACENFEQEKETTCSILYNNKLKKTYAKIVCKCGFKYNVFYSISNATVKQTFKICEYGIIWENRVLELLNQGVPLKRIAKKLNCHLNVIKLFLSKSGKISSQIGDLKIQNKIIAYRSKWIELISNREINNGLNLKKLDNEFHEFLFLYDNEWLNLVNTIYENQQETGKFKLDWKLIDEEVFNVVTQILVNLKGTGFKGRITKGLIAKLLNKGPSYIDHYKDRLPKAFKLISNSIETLRDYRLRRIDEAIIDLVNQDEALTPLKVIRKAGITKLKDESIFAYAETMVQRYRYA